MNTTQLEYFVSVAELHSLQKQRRSTMCHRQRLRSRFKTWRKF